MNEILEILEDIKPNVEFEDRDDLIDGGVLDSMSIIRLVGELQDEFDIEITVVDIVPENFNSVAAMQAMVERLQDED